jgi:CheY-like chemotaxis protein
MRILILDDEEIRHRYFALKYEADECVHCYTAEEALACMRDGPRFDAATLDHDLGYGMNGTVFANTLVDPEQFPREKLPPIIVVHSFNMYRARSMVDLFRDAGVDSRWERFGL